MRGFTFKFTIRTGPIHETEKYRHTMTPNKLAVYFVADMVLADMVVANIDFPCGR